MTRISKETKDEAYMLRCFDLAKLGAGKVSPNPMVGAVLVYEDTIIGEGYHGKYGAAHAEVNAVNSVTLKDQHLISKSTLYVSLEPCCIFGKTPPCTNLIIKNKIPRVVISCLDQTPEVSGKGVQILRDSGVIVNTGILEDKGKWVSRFRNTFTAKKRPHVILKYAQSQDGFMGRMDEQVWISNNYAKRWVHQLRAETDAILVGTNTVKTDNPSLNNRYYFGKSPIRIVLDRQLSIENQYKVYNQKQRTFIINEIKNGKLGVQVEFIKIPFNEELLPNLLNLLAKKRITSLVVEGGAKTFSSFIKTDLWDEAYILESSHLLHQGIKSPDVKTNVLDKRQIGDNTLTLHINRPL